jgi:hypothetical protein
MKPNTSGVQKLCIDVFTQYLREHWWQLSSSAQEKAVAIKASPPASSCTASSSSSLTRVIRNVDVNVTGECSVILSVISIV